MLRVACAVALAAPLCASSAPDTFTVWAEFHGKRYSSEAEREQRKLIFEQTLCSVDEWNRGGDGAVDSFAGPFADLSPEEFSQRLMPKRPAPEAALGASRALAAIVPGDLPAAFDWSEQGAVAPVRDQQALGSCWAISTAENIEGQHFLKTKSLVSMAAEQLIECDARTDLGCHGDKGSSEMGCADCGVFGGWPYLAYQYLQEAGGMFSEADWPYWHEGVYPCMADGYDREQCGNHGDLFCRQNSTKGQGPGGLCSASSGFATKVTGWQAMSQNETELAAQLTQHGPLSVLISADGLQNYHFGVWKGGWGGCAPDASRGILGLDHAVLLVGFGVEKSLLGKETPYWKVKNSWGTSWGEHGFFRMERGTGRCGVNLAATTAQVALAEDVLVV